MSKTGFSPKVAHLVWGPGAPKIAKIKDGKVTLHRKFPWFGEMELQIGRTFRSLTICQVRSKSVEPFLRYRPQNILGGAPKFAFPTSGHISNSVTHVLCGILQALRDGFVMASISCFVSEIWGKICEFRGLTQNPTEKKRLVRFWLNSSKQQCLIIQTTYERMKKIHFSNFEKATFKVWVRIKVENWGSDGT